MEENHEFMNEEGELYENVLLRAKTEESSLWGHGWAQRCLLLL